jgi:hypothetical protein
MRYFRMVHCFDSTGQVRSSLPRVRPVFDARLNDPDTNKAENGKDDLHLKSSPGEKVTI